MTGRAGDLALHAAAAALLAVVGAALLIDRRRVVAPRPLELGLAVVYLAVAAGQAYLARRRR